MHISFHFRSHKFSDLEKLSFPSTNFSHSISSKLTKYLYEAGQLIANADLCPNLGNNMKLMILVISAPDHTDRRMAIRQTWGLYCRNHNIGFGFLVGVHPKPSKNDITQTEQRTYGDLILTRNVDSFNNLTLKSVSLLEWVDTYCSLVPFVLKADDDVFINIPQLLTLLEKQQKVKRSIFGLLRRGERPAREISSKYSMSKSEYKPDIYPDYLLGPGYLMTQDSIHDLYRQALDMPYMKLEDVYITGLVASLMGIKIVNVKRFIHYSPKISFNMTEIKLTKDMYEGGQLITNADLCPNLGNNMKLMILVISAPDHTDRRMAIRQTWGFYCRHHNIGFGFLVGVHPHPSKNDITKTEQHTYGDLIQTRNVDSFNNLTLKLVSLLEWVDTYCSLVPFVLRADDDVFINIPQLLSLLEKQRKAKRSIFGRILRETRPIRKVNSKYSVSKSEYVPDVYPNYLSGPGYLMTQDSVHDLYRQALNMPYLKIDDMFITGLTASRMGIKIVNVNQFIKFHDIIPLKTTQMRKTITIHGITPRKQFLIWARMSPNL
ncbi:hypothetical protein V9T40_012920 [Parthenolecanium corni]|uniref:Hexosyltransferase n=1 Tax=Parthenolecanium corni TaxID=536013 RepID=A0AAN9XZW5_9HEMI